MSLLILRGLLLAAEALAISALLPLLSWAIGAFFARNAAMRHLVWLAVFGVLLALPLLALVAPPRMLLLHPAGSVPVDVAMAAPITATYAHSWSVEAIIAVAAAPLCALWLIGVAWNLMRLALGAHGLRRLRRGAEPFERVGTCDVRLGDAGPMTFGVHRPIIILPYDAPRWSRERLDAVLRHELAHVRRRDSLTQWLAALACAFYWLNPLVWMGTRALRRDAEIAADDAVLASGVQPSVYAAELVRLAADSQVATRFAVAMASPSSLEARVTSVLSPTPSRAGVSAMTVRKLGLLGSACALGLAFARPDIAMAQPPAPAAAPAMSDAAAMPDVAPDAARAHHEAKVRVITYGDKGEVLSDEEHGLPAGLSLNGTLSDGSRHYEFHTAHRISAQEKEQLHQSLAEMKAQLRSIHPQIEKAMSQVKIQMAGLQPRIEAAMAQAHGAQADARAWNDASHEIHEAVEEAMQEARPLIEQIARDPRMGEEVGHRIAQAFAKAQPQIDAAIARANAEHAQGPHPPLQPLPPLPPVPAAPAAPPAQVP